MATEKAKVVSGTSFGNRGLVIVHGVGGFVKKSSVVKQDGGRRRRISATPSRQFHRPPFDASGDLGDGVAVHIVHDVPAGEPGEGTGIPFLTMDSDRRAGDLDRSFYARGVRRRITVSVPDGSGPRFQLQTPEKDPSDLRGSTLDFHSAAAVTGHPYT